MFLGPRGPNNASLGHYCTHAFQAQEQVGQSVSASFSSSWVINVNDASRFMYFLNDNPLVAKLNYGVGMLVSP